MQVYKRHFGALGCMCFAVFRLNLQKLVFVCWFVCCCCSIPSMSRGAAEMHIAHSTLGKKQKRRKGCKHQIFFAEHTISFLIQNKAISMAVLLGAALQPPEYFDSLWLGSWSRCDQRLWHMFYCVILLCCWYWLMVWFVATISLASHLCKILCFDACFQSSPRFTQNMILYIWAKTWTHLLDIISLDVSSFHTNRSTQYLYTYIRM